MIGIELRDDANSPAYFLVWETFKERIQRGELQPPVEVRHEDYTENQWLTIDNLYVFFRHSPHNYPMGEYLRRKFAEEDEKKQAAAQVLEDDAKRFHQHPSGVCPVCSTKLTGEITLTGMWDGPINPLIGNPGHGSVYETTCQDCGAKLESNDLGHHDRQSAAKLKWFKKN